MTNTVYEIRDYAYEPGWVHYVSEDTTSVDDAWTTALPIDSEEAVKFEDAPKAKQFKKKAEAKLFLDTLKSARLQNWQKDGWCYKANGYQKPTWKIYTLEAQ
jgi:hypothetical protein